jgi:hypothetical protein
MIRHIPSTTNKVVKIRRLSCLAIASLLVVNTTYAQIRGSEKTKDIVVEQMIAPTMPALNSQPPADAMVVRLLAESPDGVLRPYERGDAHDRDMRYRIKILTSRAGTIELFQTDPSGAVIGQAFLALKARAGQELVTQRLSLDASRRHRFKVVLQPNKREGLFDWWNGKQDLNAIDRSEQSMALYGTPTVAYVYNPPGAGAIATLWIEKNK